ncbi:MAG TPA: malonyl-CoA decarboxylase family protein [Bradyrhizobium sp.]|nr:malonyl-CoA decarboxylase family protein [Bradyrhizobium sp.]
MKLQQSRLAVGAAPALLGELFEVLSERGRSFLRRRDRFGGSQLRLADLGEQLLSRRGEASGTAIAAGLIARFRDADEDECLEFLIALAERFGPDLESIDQAIAAYAAEASAENLSRLHAAAEPRRQELIRRINLAFGGTAALVLLREELLRRRGRHPELKAVDADFVHLFSSWFNRGFLVLRRIDWSTPANILEKIIRYEAVHAIRDWDDLRNRLEPGDRRCYGFFHPQLVDEPLIFVEVALTQDMPSAISPLLDLGRPVIGGDEATTAVFYSISNTQRGLAGVSFGNFLIKQVVEDLKQELPNLSRFVTLSPVPAFAEWLARLRANDDRQILDAEMKQDLAFLDRPNWWADEERTASLAPLMRWLAAYYFFHAKGRDGRPLDPVARFHLGNGARLQRLNPLGDTSAKGLQQSFGLMVNYLYDLTAIETNHEAFAEKGTVVAEASIGRLAASRAG